ncbi:MAG: hypothetical protein ACP5UL_05570 [Thermoplasmata archaeon]
MEEKISEILSGVKAIWIKSKNNVITITSMSEESKVVINKLGVVGSNNIL